MTILFAGTETEAFIFTGVPVIATNPADYDATYVRLGIIPTDYTGSMASPKWAAGETDLWLHFDFALSDSAFGDSVYYHYLRSDSGTNLIEVSGSAVDAAGVKFRYWNGSTMVLVGSHALFPASVANFDVNYRNTVDGRIALYVNSVLVAEVTGDFSALADARDYCHKQSRYGGGVSQVIVADTPTLGFKLAYRQPTGAGNYTAWTGTFNEVDNTLSNDASFISSDTATERESFVKSIFAVPAGMVVQAVGVSARARRGASGPQKINLSLRFGSTDYDSADKTLELGFTTIQNFWELNPATSLPWVGIDAGSATLEFGVEAVA